MMNRRSFLSALPALALLPYTAGAKNAKLELLPQFVYAWNATQKGVPAPTLAGKLARRPGMTVLLASAGKSATSYPAYADTLRNAGVRVGGVIANNEYVHPERLADFKQGVTVAARHANEVHLDVEPQVLPDFRERREYYIRRLAHIAGVAKRMAGDKPVSVAVPYWFTLAETQVIAQQADVIHLMTYGLAGAERKAARLAAIRAKLGDSRVVLTLRATDFSTQVELAAWALQLSSGKTIPVSVHEYLAYSALG